MAIYSLHHEPIGKTTQARPHTASAHVRYISRNSALAHFEAEHLPEKPGKAAQHLREIEDHDRINARVIDKVLVALPIELSMSEQVQLVRGYARSITKGRAGWLAAFHTKEQDADNPHAHIVFRDRDFETGDRVARLSDKGSTNRLRSLWEVHVNMAMALAGRKERVSARSLKDQRIDRLPTIHEGPKGQAMDAKGKPAHSRRLTCRNGPGARSRERVVDYPAIDGTRSRPAYNRAIRQAETEADFWHAIDADRHLREFAERGFGSDARRWPLMQRPVVASPLGDGITERKEPVSLGVHRVPLPGTLATPRVLESFFLGPAPLKKGADGVGERQRVDPLASDTLNPPNKSISNVHDEKSIGQYTSNLKANTMDDNERMRRAHHQQLMETRFRAEQAAARYESLMARSYLNPAKAGERMRRLHNKNPEKIYRILKGNERKTAFGRRPNSMASLGFWKRNGKGQINDSYAARRLLPDAVRQHYLTQEDLRAAQLAYDKSFSSPAAAGQTSPSERVSAPSSSKAKPRLQAVPPSKSSPAKKTPEASPKVAKPIYQTPPNYYQRQAEKRAEQARQREQARAAARDRVPSNIDRTAPQPVSPIRLVGPQRPQGPYVPRSATFAPAVQPQSSPATSSQRTPDPVAERQAIRDNVQQFADTMSARNDHRQGMPTSPEPPRAPSPSPTVHPAPPGPARAPEPAAKSVPAVVASPRPTVPPAPPPVEHLPAPRSAEPKPAPSAAPANAREAEKRRLMEQMRAKRERGNQLEKPAPAARPEPANQGVAPPTSREAMLDQMRRKREREKAKELDTGLSK